MKYQTRKYFFQELKYFFSIGVWHIVVLLSLLLLKFEKCFRKGYYYENFNFCIKQYFLRNKRNNFYQFRTDVPIRFHVFYSQSRCCKKQRNHETSEKLDIKQAKSSVDVNIQSIQSISNCSQSIQRLQFRLTSAFATFFDAYLVILALIVSASTLFSLPSLGRSLK